MRTWPEYHARRRCRRTGADNRATSALTITGRAQPLLEGNTARGNQDRGIFYHDHAAGTAINNICESNRKYGMYLAKQAKPSVKGSVYKANRIGGVERGR